jgi:hypothetical protein
MQQFARVDAVDWRRHPWHKALAAAVSAAHSTTQQKAGFARDFNDFEPDLELQD